MDNQKFEAVVGYFEDLNIDLPYDVKNSIEDVFRENDEIEDVQCYHAEDAEQFGIDLAPQNIVIMNTNGGHSGESVSFFTYYGEVEHDLLEQIILYEGEEVHTEISKIDGTGRSKILDVNDYIVILVERTVWDNSTPDSNILTLQRTLMIYCPISGDGLSEEDLKFQGIYNDIKADESYE